MRPRDWISEFLSKRRLEKPSGKPMYSYKITTLEYKELIEILRMSREYSYRWDACFILFACEWWRRNYDGGHWTWEPMLDLIDKEMELEVPYRYEVVSDGFKYWKRTIYKGRKRSEYLGTVLVESGIPQNILNDQHYISDLINRLYNELGAISSMQEDYLSFIEREAELLRLPRSLQQDPFYALIGDIVSTLVDLQETFDLSVQKKPVAYLDTVSKDWRDNFPIRVENALAKSFIDNLLSDVAKTPPPRGYLAKIDYTLENIAEEWFCKSSFSIEKGIHRFDRFGLSEDEYKGLSNKLELYCSNGEMEFRVGYMWKIPDKESIKTDGVLNQPLDQNALTGHQWSIFLSDPNTGKNFDLPLSDIDFTAEGEPLVFASSEHSWRLIGSGSVCSKAEQLRVLVNESAVVNGDTYLEIGRIEPENLIFEISGDCLINDQENTFRITPNSDDDRIRYEFHPLDNARVFPFFPRQNKHVFLGFPKVYQINSHNGRASRVLSGLEYLNNGTWDAMQGSVFGKLRVRLRTGSETHFVKTIAVLPPDLSFRFGTDGLSSLQVATKSKLAIRVKSEIPSQINQLTTGKSEVIFDISDLSNEDIPEHFHLECLFGSGVKPVRISIPFPKRDVVIYDKKGFQIPKDRRLYVDNLPGSRISISNHADEIIRKRVIVSLHAKDVHQEVRISRTIDVFPYQYESLPMISFYHQFNRLFSLTSNIDSYLQFEIDDQRIRIAQFPDVKYDFKADGFLFEDVDDYDNLRVNALRLDVPFTEGAIQFLDFAPEKEVFAYPIGDGLWMIYPHPTSNTTFRPRTVKILVEGKQSDDDSIKEMHEVALLPFDQRGKKLMEIYSYMVDDLSHPDWVRLSRLFEVTAHLPLSIFNNWDCIVENPEALILGVFMFQKELTERLTEEFSIVWQEYPLNLWISAYEKYAEFAKATYGEYAGTIMDTKLEVIEDLLGLQAHAFILKGKSQPLSEPILNMLIMQELNGREGQAGLRARHEREMWPDKFSSILKIRARELPGFVKKLLPGGIPESQKGIVYLPFVLAAAANALERVTIRQSEILNRFRMTEMIEFDEQWFELIYGYVLGYIWNHQEKKND